MSVASLAIQIRAPCARSMACKLGSPITLLPPPPPAIPAHVPDQILALPSDSGRSAAGLRSARRSVGWPGLPPLALPRISPQCFPTAVSSTSSHSSDLRNSKQRLASVSPRDRHHPVPLLCARQSIDDTSSDAIAAREESWLLLHQEVCHIYWYDVPLLMRRRIVATLPPPSTENGCRDLTTLL